MNKPNDALERLASIEEREHEHDVLDPEWGGESSDEDWLPGFAWTELDAPEVRFRMIAIELFGELEELTTAESSGVSIRDMIRSCDWIAVRTSDVAARLHERMKDVGAMDIGEDDTSPVGDRVARHGLDYVIGSAGIPAWAVARFISEGMTDDSIMELWDKDISLSDVNEVRRRLDLYPELMALLPDQE